MRAGGRSLVFLLEGAPSGERSWCSVLLPPSNASPVADYKSLSTAQSLLPRVHAPQRSTCPNSPQPRHLPPRIFRSIPSTPPAARRPLNTYTSTAPALAPLLIAILVGTNHPRWRSGSRARALSRMELGTCRKTQRGRTCEERVEEVLRPRSGSRYRGTQNEALSGRGMEVGSRQDMEIESGLGGEAGMRGLSTKLLSLLSLALGGRFNTSPAVSSHSTQIKSPSSLPYDIDKVDRP
ncbi:hypothetical protein R3P38DRAFT_114299, partial [Favolaschia claudopus]